MLEVFQNLIENAIKFMGEQADPRIVIGARGEGDKTVYYVADNGIGIDPTYREKVFGMFDKLDPSARGTGIGLALVKRIIEVHGGRVWMESPGPGAGLEFCGHQRQDQPESGALALEALALDATPVQIGVALRDRQPEPDSPGPAAEERLEDPG